MAEARGAPAQRSGRARGARARPISSSSAAATSRPAWMSCTARDLVARPSRRGRARCRVCRHVGRRDHARRALGPLAARGRRRRRGRDVRMLGLAPCSLDTPRRGRRLERGALVRGRARAGARSARPRPTASRAAARCVVGSGGKMLGTRRAGSRVRGATAWQARRSRRTLPAERHELFDSTLAARRRRDAPHGGRGAAVPRSPAAAGRSDRGRPMALARAARRQARAAARVSESRSCASIRICSAAMRIEQVTLLATSGTTSDRLQVIWEWSWWDPQEREAMRLNARIARAMRPRRLSRGRADDAGLRRRHVPLRQPDAGRAQHRRHPVLQRERRPDALDRQRVRADAARVVRVRAARRRSRSGVPRDHRARRARSAACACRRRSSSR